MSTETQTAQTVLETHIGHAPPATIDSPKEEAPPTPREKMSLTTRLVQKRSGGLLLMPQTFGEAVELAKSMSKAEGAVGAHLLGNPGGCLMIVMLGLEWGMSPFAVARHSYVAQKVKANEPIGQICFEAQLYIAVANKLAPIEEGRLKHKFTGNGDDLRCTVYATFKGDEEVTELESEPLRTLRPGSNSDGDVKGSPLWRKKPRQQLFYNTGRDWVRANCPEIMLGVYTHDELMDYAEEFIGEPKKKIDPFAGPGPRLLAKEDASDHVHCPAETRSPADPGASSSNPCAVISSPAQANSEAVESKTPASVSSSNASDGADQSDVAGAPGRRVGAPAPSPEDIARMGGRDAYASGLEETDNPHTANSAEWLAWIEGFHEGAR